jgi:uncharacterized damage-inducible protein DinB
MQKKVQNRNKMKSIEHIVKQYGLLTDWYLSVLEGIEDKDGSKTMSEHTNSLEWLAGHLLTGRYRNIIRLGVQIEPYKYLDKFINQTLPPPNAIKFDKAIQYPGLTECRKQWMEYGKIFLDRLNVVDENILKSEIPFTVMTGGNTVEDALTFMALHETFHIGQMSIMRKAMGYSAMQLARRQ